LYFPNAEYLSASAERSGIIVALSEASARGLPDQKNVFRCKWLAVAWLPEPADQGARHKRKTFRFISLATFVAEVLWLVAFPH
jgi:hypothetical protein